MSAFINSFLFSSRSYLLKEVNFAPLAFFRIVFGFVMFLSMIRFVLKGWVDTLYIQPEYFFPFYGFEWLRPLGAVGMYSLFFILAISALFIGLGLFYKWSSTIFFILFTYIELLDKSNYLNHYYFISIVAFLLLLVPAGNNYSLDVRFGIVKKMNTIPMWCLFIFQLQLAVVYLYAGIAKINSDWLFHAMPLKIWLPSKYDIPIIGPLLDEVWVAYFFSWAGMLYDICIPFLLFWRRTSYFAIALVIIFHILTAILFPMIGMFPFIMLMAALIFLPEAFHIKILHRFRFLSPLKETAVGLPYKGKNILYLIIVIHFFIQIVVPLRFLMYPDRLFWTEQGYRFSWRVMLMEKAGYATFTVVDKETNTFAEIRNLDYLTVQQEKMMVTQPDMMIQFAKLVKEAYLKKGMHAPEVYVESYVTLNGRASKPFIDSKVDLTKCEDGFKHKAWILSAGY